MFDKPTERIAEAGSSEVRYFRTLTAARLAVLQIFQKPFYRKRSGPLTKSNPNLTICRYIQFLCNNSIGNTLQDQFGQSNLRSFDRLACALSDVSNMGYEVILVSSGAIAAGPNKLNRKAQPSGMRMKQAVATVGKCSIMYFHDKFFNDYDKTIAQILLNAEDMEQEEKREHLTNTYNTLLGWTV